MHKELLWWTEDQHDDRKRIGFWHPELRVTRRQVATEWVKTSEIGILLDLGNELTNESFDSLHLHPRHPLNLLGRLPGCGKKT